MKHSRHFEEMTFTSLSRRADSVNTDYAVCEIIGGGDYRAVTAFMEHDTSTRPNGDDEEYATVGKRIIGVALCDLDDPLAEVTVWDRDTAWTEFGRAWIEKLEDVE